jgi:hypothetical protein
MKPTLVLASTFALVAAAAFASGCVVHVDDDGHHHDDDGGPPPASDPYFATVDRNEVLSTDLGEGAGLFVEYAEGGRWTLWTSCDTALSGRACLWDVYVSGQEPIDGLEGLDVEADDDFGYSGSKSMVFYANTTLGSDAVTFETDPGSLIRLEVYLDGLSAPDYLVWMGNGTVNNGAPRLPVVFQPDAP